MIFRHGFHGLHGFSLPGVSVAVPTDTMTRIFHILNESVSSKRAEGYVTKGRAPCNPCNPCLKINHAAFGNIFLRRHSPISIRGSEVTMPMHLENCFLGF